MAAKKLKKPKTTLKIVNNRAYFFRNNRFAKHEVKYHNIEDKKVFRQFKISSVKIKTRRNIHRFKKNGLTFTDKLSSDVYRKDQETKRAKYGRERLVKNLTKYPIIQNRDQARMILTRSQATTYRFWFFARVLLLDARGNVIDSNVLEINSRKKNLDNPFPQESFFKWNEYKSLGFVEDHTQRSRNYVNRALSPYVVNGRGRYSGGQYYRVDILVNSATYKHFSPEYTRITKGRTALLSPVVVKPFMKDYQYE